MTDIISHVVAFLIETIILVAAILIVFAGLASAISKARNKQNGNLRIQSINAHYQDLQDTIQNEILDKKALKKLRKASKKAAKEPLTRSRIFVIDFSGDIKASAVKSLREEVSAIIKAAEPSDQVLIRLESTGGMVHAYGLAASQLQRLKDARLKLIASVDKVAASGGYMMACVADEIIAAPFAILGSVGVIAQIPNFHRLLKKKDIDFEQITAGEFKRTLTLFGENTEKDRQKMQGEVNETHELFKQFVLQHRPQLDITKIATGEHWFGLQAKELQLIDRIQSSDDWLMSQTAISDIYKVEYQFPKKARHKIAMATKAAIDSAYDKLLEKQHNQIIES